MSEPPSPQKPDPEGWDSYWKDLRERSGLFREQAAEYVRRLEAVLPLDASAHVLDFGCGFGFVAAALAPRVGCVSLWDDSGSMQRRVRVNVAGHSNVRFLDLSRPERVPSDRRFDLILVNSVIQYMRRDEFVSWLGAWRGMLAAQGRVVISDLITPDHSVSSDILDLLRFSTRHGILGDAVFYLAGDVWRYWRVRRATPLTAYSHEELCRLAHTAGLAVILLPQNLTHFRTRRTAVFTRRD